MATRRRLYDDSDADASFSKGRRQPDADFDITPMIDCVFLLLIFFMVTSNMQKDTKLHVPTARHGAGFKADEAMIISILSGETPQVLLGDGKGEPAQLGSGDIDRYVQAGLDAKKKKRMVIIKADRDVPHGFVQKVTREVNEPLQQVEGAEFSIGVRDQPH